MSMIAHLTCRNWISAAMAAGVLLGAGAVWTQSGAQPAGKSTVAIPDFSSGDKTWVLMNGTAYLRVPDDPGPGPIVQRGKPYKHDVVPRIADTDNPILKPWAKKLMDINNKRVIAGGLPFVTASRCWPGGVPGLLLYPGEPVVFLQHPDEVWIVGRDEQVRRVYMNVPHSKDPGYSNYGDSVGHYENGDTLVIDTIGLDDKGPIDRYRTPHTKQLHVVERYRLTNGGKNLEVIVDVEDPGAFTMPWKAKVEFARGRGNSGTWKENVCSENTEDFFLDNRTDVVPEPQTARRDF
jgi:hypothetical protein